MSEKYKKIPRLSRRQLLRTAGAGVLVGGVASSTASADGTLSYGDTVTGTTAETWSFSAEENDVVSIDLRLDNPIDFTGEIVLRRPNGEQIASIDGGGEDGNAALSLYELPRIAGTYSIDIQTTANESIGYTMSLYRGIPVDHQIAYGDSVASEITRSDRYYNHSYIDGYHKTYAFEASQGDEITIEMRPDNEIDNTAQLVLYDPDGERVFDDDTPSVGEDGNAVITRYPVDRGQDGEYTIVATGIGHTDRFSYELFLYEGIPIDQEIAYGDSVASEITRSDRYYQDTYIDGYHETYSFEASEGDEVTIEMRPDNEIDNTAQLVLYDPDGERVFDDDTPSVGEEGNAVITQYLIEEGQGGTYTIVATGQSLTDRFAYELFLYEGIPIDEFIEYGDTVKSELTREDRYYQDTYIDGYHETYAFEAKGDNVVTIEMSPENQLEENAQLALYDPDGNRVNADRFQSGEDGNALIAEHDISGDGKYTVVATGAGRTDRFVYTLELTLNEGTPPNTGQPSDVDQAVWDAVTGQNDPAGSLTFEDLIGAIQAYQGDGTIDGTTITFQDLVDLIQWYQG